MADIDRTQLMKAMRDLGRQRGQARARAVGLTHQLAPLIAKAREMDLPITEISEITGLSRPAIYKLLRGDPQKDVDIP